MAPELWIVQELEIEEEKVKVRELINKIELDIQKNKAVFARELIIR